MTVRKTTLVSMAAVALWAIPTIASAHAGNDDPNVVHACIGNISKVVRVVGVTGVCIAAPSLIAEAPAHWAVKGKDGTNGIDGANVTFVDYFSGSAGGCSNGGAIYAAGNPPVHTYVCNGTNGIDGEDGAAGTRADGPCFDNLTRYLNCGNGTVTDQLTGLIWLKQSDCLPYTSWADAHQFATGLKDGDCGLTDKSSPGDWRLPTKDEWSVMIARAVALGCVFGLSGGPSLTNDAGTACYGTGNGSSFTYGPANNYWSGTTNESNPVNAWFARLSNGDVFDASKFFTLRSWPVRGGPR